MRWSLLLASALAVAMTVTGTSDCSAQRATLDRIMHTAVLDNGMQIIVIENHSIPIVTTEVVFRAGAMTQGEQDQGVPHLFEHMLFKSYRGELDEPFDWDVARAHAAYNGSTSDEHVAYYLALPSANTDDALGILARLVRKPRFENADFQSERFVVLNEADRDASDPEFHLKRETSARLWGTGFPTKNTIGDRMALLAVTIPQLRTIFERYYVPNNAALIITGDVTAAQAFEMARTHFGGWKRQPDPFISHPVPVMPPLDSSRAVVITANVTTVTLEIAWRGPSVTDDPRGAYAADVLTEIASDDQSAFHAHLVDSGLFQEADLRYTTRSHVGPITFYGVTTPAKLAAALTALDTELDYMEVQSYFGPETIAAATRRHAVEDVFHLENAHTLALELADTWAVAGTDYFRNYSENMVATSAADLHSYVERYLAHKPFVIAALVAPEQSAPTVTLLREYLTMVGQ